VNSSLSLGEAIEQTRKSLKNPTRGDSTMSTKLILAALLLGTASSALANSQFDVNRPTVQDGLSA
jgi:hypothetical protein